MTCPTCKRTMETSYKCRSCDEIGCWRCVPIDKEFRRLCLKCGGSLRPEDEEKPLGKALQRWDKQWAESEKVFHAQGGVKGFVPDAKPDQREAETFVRAAKVAEAQINAIRVCEILVGAYQDAHRNRCGVDTEELDRA